MITPAQIARLTQQIKDIAQPERIILFGSYAYGEPQVDSDLDIMVILPFEGHWVHKASEIRQQLPLCDFSLDLLVRTPKQVKARLEIGDPFMQEIMKSGKVLYESAHTRVG
jgi:uncharacterized protein